MITVTDMFCGAGGSTLGATMNPGVESALALNHWPVAIESHNSNFPNARHHCANVSMSDPRYYPSTEILIASPECTNHSPAKGAQRRKMASAQASMFEDGPSGSEEQDRSRATMQDVLRFAEVHRYKAIIVENVTDAFRWGPDDNGALFDHWLRGFDILGYDHEIVWANSMFIDGTIPQSRDRMYVVFWLKTLRKPNLRIEPPSLCVHCGPVNGRQSWKPRVALRPNGRYGPQYVYRCPNCAEIVFPAALPAAAAIDWSIPATKIGERERPLAKNTLDRIRRGMTRLNERDETLGVERGMPRPTTIPLTYATKLRPAMLTPVAGNTFERTPGNRARDANTTPFATVHGTPETALVLPPMTNGAARSANDQPAPTMTTTTRPAVVIAQRSNDSGRLADTMPAQTVVTNNHHGVVIANYNPGWARNAGQEPFGSVTTKDGHSLLVPYYTKGECVDPSTSQSPTLTTRDRVGLAWGDADLYECQFRMFALHEIARTMGLHMHTNGQPYQVVGNKRERMAQYGNAVTPPVMRELVSRLVDVLDAA